MVGGLGRFLVLQRQPAQVIVDLGVGRVVAEDGLELFGGPLVIAAAQINVGQVSPHPLLDHAAHRGAV